MDRALLMIAALALLGCNAAPPERAESHADLACAACHRGNKADVGRASVPREACTASGCHEDAGPPEVTLATATFEHRNHGVNGEITPNCAGCHTHEVGDKPLTASLDACALCHKADLAANKDNECRLCHRQLKHKSMTSQGIPVSHGSLPWMETGCSRCHYDVLAPQKKIDLGTCMKCHDRTSEVTRQGIARDLHPAHRGLGCTSCHEAGLHRIGAMSSAVNLVCSDCHSRAHEQEVTAGQSRACGQCHGNSHSAQQRLMLGFVGDEPVLPSAKFMLGMTCRSCHMPPGAPAQAATARRGHGDACAACHEGEYRKVLGWWISGSRTRADNVAAYIATARNALAASAGARTLLTNADAQLGLVRAAGGQHNLELSDAIFRASIADVVKAYKLAGRVAPAPPELGNTPHVGTCSFCHYAETEKLDFNAPRPDLHERLIRTRR